MNRIKLCKILSGLIVFTLFMTLLSPFYVFRSVILELTYTTNSKTSVMVEAYRSHEKVPLIPVDTETYNMPVARQPQTIRLELPSDNRVGCVVTTFPEIISTIKIHQATLIAHGKCTPLSFKNIRLIQKNKERVIHENGTLLVKPGKRVTFQFILDDGLKVARRVDFAVLLYISLLSLLPALLIFRKFNPGVTSKGTLNLLYSTASVICLTCPALLVDYYSIISDENRFINSFPHVFIHRRFNISFPKQLEEWFSDRFWGRAPAIKNEKIIFSQDVELNTSVKAIIGRDHWIFIRLGKSVEMYQNKNRFTDQQLEICAKNVTLLNHYLQKKNIKLYILLTPDKERVYSEYYPPMYKQMHPESRLEQLTHYLTQNTPVKVICPLKELREGKKDTYMYFKPGSHWTYRGAYTGISLLLQEIKKDFPNMPMDQPNGMEWKKELCADTDAARAAGYSDPEKQLPQEELIYDKHQIHCKYTSQIFEEATIGHGIFTKYTAEHPAPGSIRAFAITDSFFGYGLSFMFPAAKELYHAPFARGEYFELAYVRPYLEKLPVDIVIIESTERFLDRFLVLGID